MVIDAVKMSLNVYAVMGFLVYMLGAAAVFAVFTFIYVRLTPHSEFVLIREGNTAAATGLAGAMMGFAIPISSVIFHSISLLDFLVWAVIAGGVQLLAFVAVSLITKGLAARIQNGETASAILVAAISISIGLLNAACMTPSA